MISKPAESWTVMDDRARGGIVWLLLVIFFGLACWDFYLAFILVGNPVDFISKRLIVFLAALPFAACFWGFWLRAIITGRFPTSVFETILSQLIKIPAVARISAAILLLSTPAFLLLYSPVGDYHPGYWLRLFLLCLFAFLATFLVFPRKIDLAWILRLSALVLAAGAIFTTADWLNDVTSYPFSMNWSEGNRMWDFSMMFGSSRYVIPNGKEIFTFIETGRQFLWGLPFLLPNLSIFGFRLWNALVWILPSALLTTCSVVGKTRSGRNWWWSVIFILWGYLFLSQGPIYSPLLLSAALVVIAIRQKNLLLSMILIAAAAHYCQISRWMWLYAPGLWAGLLALLDADNPDFSREGWKKLIRPVAFGLSGYFGAQWLKLLFPTIESGFDSVTYADAIVLVPSISSDMLLLDRLFPNPTYPPGILLGSVLVGLPPIFLLILFWKERIWKPNLLQLASISVIFIAFYLVGIVVSLKIGGGSNLHNLDMLWVSVVIVAGLLWKKWMDSGLPGPFEYKKMIPYLAVAAFFPAALLIQYGDPLHLPPEEETQEALETVRLQVADARTKGEVLFIDQRQLLTFGYIKDLPLVDEFEKKYLMEKAMSGDLVYLQQFESDLANRNYSLIVTEPVSENIVGDSEKSFAEENNAWVAGVSRPLIKYYRPAVTMESFGVQLLVPREKVEDE